MDKFQEIWAGYARDHKAALDAVAPRYQGKGYDIHSFVKYFNAEAQIKEKLRFAELLGLVGSQPKTTLDIGAGMGWFSYVAKALGHIVYLADLPLEYGVSIEAYEAGITALGMTKSFDCIIRRQQPLKMEPGEFLVDIFRYDVITATGTCFEKNWTGDDWRFFLADLIDNHLLPDGKILLQLNKTPGPYEALRSFDFAALRNVASAEWKPDGCVTSQTVLITTQEKTCRA